MDEVRFELIQKEQFTYSSKEAYGGFRGELTGISGGDSERLDKPRNVQPQGAVVSDTVGSFCCGVLGVKTGKVGGSQI